MTSHTSTVPKAVPVTPKYKELRDFLSQEESRSACFQGEQKGGISVKQPHFFLLLQRSLLTNTGTMLFWITGWLIWEWRARHYSLTRTWISTFLKIFRTEMENAYRLVNCQQEKTRLPQQEIFYKIQRHYPKEELVNWFLYTFSKIIIYERAFTFWQPGSSIVSLSEDCDEGFFLQM